MQSNDEIKKLLKQWQVAQHCNQETEWQTIEKTLFTQYGIDMTIPDICNYYLNKYRLIDVSNEPYNYCDLRAAVKEIFVDFLLYEFPIVEDGEFDHEFMEVEIDHILRLIQRQGGRYADK